MPSSFVNTHLVGKCSPVIGKCLRCGWKTFSGTLSTLIARFIDLGLNFVPQCPIMYPNVAFSRKIWEGFPNTHPLRRFRHAPGMKSWLYMPEVTLGLPCTNSVVKTIDSDALWTQLSLSVMSRRGCSILLRHSRFQKKSHLAVGPSRSSDMKTYDGKRRGQF